MNIAPRAPHHVTGHVPANRLTGMHLRNPHFDRRSSQCHTGIRWLLSAILVAALLFVGCTPIAGPGELPGRTPAPNPRDQSSPTVGYAPPAPGVDEETLARIQAVTAGRDGRFLSPLVSPDGQWQAEVEVYDCTPVGDEDEWSVELLTLAPANGDSRTTVASQVINCGGLGAFGLAAREWSDDGRFLYYTDAREGIPDGQGEWVKPVLRYDTVTGAAERMESSIPTPTDSAPVTGSEGD